MSKFKFFSFFVFQFTIYFQSQMFGQWAAVKKDKDNIRIIGPNCRELKTKIEYIRLQSKKSGYNNLEFPKLIKNNDTECYADIRGSISPDFIKKLKSTDKSEPPFHLQRNSKNRLILSGENCAEVESEARNFREWTQRIGQKASDNLPISTKNDKQCSVDITEQVPDFVVKFHDTHALYDGPNCYNFALVVSSILPGFRNVSDDEAAFFIQSPLCQPVETPQSGDIGIVKGISQNVPNGKMVHGFVYISENLVLSKANYLRLSPYAIQTKDRMIEQLNAYDSYSTSYYRCISRQEFLQKNEKNISKELRNLVKQFDDFECQYSQQFLNPSKLSDKMFLKTMVDTAEILDAVLQDEKQKLSKPGSNVKDTDVIILNMLEQRIRHLVKNFVPGIKRFVKGNYEVNPSFNVWAVQYEHDPAKGKLVVKFPNEVLQIPYEIEKDP